MEDVMEGIECHVVMRAYGTLANDEDGDTGDEAIYAKTEVQGVFFTQEEADIAARRIFAEDVLQQEEVEDEDLEDITGDYEGATDEADGQVGLLLEKIDDSGETDLELDCPANKVWVERSAVHGEPPGFMKIDMGDVDTDGIDMDDQGEEVIDEDDEEEEEEPVEVDEEEGEEPGEADEDEPEDEEEPEDEDDEDGEETGQLAGTKHGRDEDEDEDGDGDGDDDEEEG